MTRREEPASRSRRRLLALVLLGCTLAGCEEKPARTAPEPAPVTREEAAPGESSGTAREGHALGIGEPRAPEPFTLEQRFLQAARDGDRRTLERALERGVAPGAKDDLGRNALLLAVRHTGDLALAQFLAERGAPLDEPDASGRAALSWAASLGHLEIARWLAEAGAEVDRADAERRTPLFHAAAGGHREVAELLLERGADPNATDRFGDTPLIFACAKGLNEMAALLLARGADAGRRDQEGRTARERAAPGADACRGGASAATPPR